MTTTVIGLFNNKGGVGKTSLVYHLAWIYADLGVRVVAADLDPQANLTAAFLDDDRLEELWPEDTPHHKTIFGCIEPMIRGTGDLGDPCLERIDDGLALLAGDLSLSVFEDELSQQWPACLDRRERAFRIVSAFWRILQNAARVHKADMVLVDLGPNLGAINRAALIAIDHILFPLSPDLFSLRGLRNLGPTVRRWREEWTDRLARRPEFDLELPDGGMAPSGYIVLQHAVRLDRPVKAYEKWLARIPGVYRSEVLDSTVDAKMTVKNDPHCLALLKHYRSLMPLAHEARKPMFHLKPADGAIGAHMALAHEVYRDFKRLAEVISSRTGVPIPAGAS